MNSCSFYPDPFLPPRCDLALPSVKSACLCASISSPANEDRGTPAQTEPWDGWSSSPVWAQRQRWLLSPTSGTRSCPSHVRVCRAPQALSRLSGPQGISTGICSHIPPPPPPPPALILAPTSAPRQAWDFGTLRRDTLWIAALQSEPAGGGASRGLGAGPRGSASPTASWPVTGKEGIEIFKDQVDPLGSPDGRILSYCGCNSPFGLQSPLPHLG